MENATKAFYMVAATMIALFVLYLMIFMFRSAARVGENYDQKKGQENIDKFNSQFETFVTGNDENVREDFKVASDVVTAINLAYDVNKQNGYDNVEFVKILVKDKRGNVRYSLQNDSRIPKNTMIDGVSLSTSGDNTISTNDFLKLEWDRSTGKKLSDVKLLDNKYVYRYYFMGNVLYNSRTGKVNEVDFTITETSDF